MEARTIFTQTIQDILIIDMYYNVHVMSHLNGSQLAQYFVLGHVIFMSLETHGNAGRSGTVQVAYGRNSIFRIR